MNIDKKRLDRLAKLSMFEFTDEQKDGLLKDMNDIVKYVENLNELDLSQEDLLSKENSSPLREDVVVKSDVMNDLTKDFKYIKNGSFVLPQIIE